MEEKQVYVTGRWTESALKTLEWIHTQNKDGKNPKRKDFPNGTMKNWISALQEGDFLKKTENGGFVLTEDGLILLHNLTENPPKRTRKKKIKFPQTQKEVQEEAVYNLSINGKDISFELLLTREEVFNYMRFISEIKVKKQ